MNLQTEIDLSRTQPMTTQSQTETMAFMESQFDFKLPIVDLDDQVENIRKRAEIILEKLLALPNPQKKPQSPNAKQVQKKIIPKNIEEDDDNDDEILTEIVNPPVQNSVVKSSPPTKGKKKKSKKKKEPQYIIPKREPIVIPGANERYEQQLILLQQQLQRLNTENNKLQSLIREYNIKLRESVIEQEKLQYTLQQSQKHRLHVNPTPKDKAKSWQ